MRSLVIHRFTSAIIGELPDINIDADEVGKTAVYLLSDLSSGVTGENIYVDSGFNIVGL
jgi:enoyl-[acyl-carrier-protein] reductase (NADH)